MYIVDRTLNTEGGADLEAQSSSLRFDTLRSKGITPLHTAAFNLNLIPWRCYCRREGANVNAKDDRWLTPLHVVCKTVAMTASAFKRADFLLRTGADETIPDNDGNTPKDLIENSDQAASLHRLMAIAPADRTWRSRGIPVLCRARSNKMLGGVGDETGGKAPCQEKEVGASATAGDHGRVMVQVVGLKAEEVFRSFVRFL